MTNPNLLDSLLASAHGQEDPLTETLAWFLRVSALIRNGVLEPIAHRMGAANAVLQNVEVRAEPTIATQVIVADPRGGTCRYDLVLDWHTPRERLVIEVKVWADLTWKEETDPDTLERQAADQVTRYLRIAREDTKVRSRVIVLAPYAVALTLHPSLTAAFGGQITWQDVHDAFIRVRARGGLDHTLDILAHDFIKALEIRRMAAPKLTFDALTSVYRYRRFEQSISAVLTHARDALFEDRTLEGFHKGDQRAWQDAYDRLGWRLWVNPTLSGYFAFFGIYVGANTVHEEVPDLYFALEVPKGTAAANAIDANKDDIEAALASLSNATTKWRFKSGGYQTITASQSLVESARQSEVSDAATVFFRECVTAMRSKGLLQRFLDAAPKQNSGSTQTGA